MISIDVPSRRSVWPRYVVTIIPSGFLPSLRYPGFDTASSIALLAVTALAKSRSDGPKISQTHIIVLPVRNSTEIEIICPSPYSLIKIVPHSFFSRQQ